MNKRNASHGRAKATKSGDAIEPLQNLAAEVEPEYKKKYREVMQKIGEIAIDQRLNEQQQTAAAEILAKGVALKGIFDRPTEEEATRNIEYIARRVADIVEERLRPDLRLELSQILREFSIALAASAVWDLMNVLMPHLHNLFMAAEPTDYMRRIAAFATRNAEFCSHQ